MVIRDLYQNISLKVKLLDGISDIFYINQDVRQERIPSIYTGFYKVNILKAIKNATGTSVIFPINVSLIRFVFVLTTVPNIGVHFTKT